MIQPDDIDLKRQLEIDEDRRHHVYRDTKGIETVGIGHNLRARPLPAGWCYPLSDAQIDQLYAEDVAVVFADLNRTCPWWAGMTDNRQRVLANMCFNMGWPVLSQFVNTLKAMASGDYDKAADGMKASKWAGQVGARATRLIAAMRKG